MEIRIALDLEDFVCLVRGGELTIHDEKLAAGGVVKLILKDIGFGEMRSSVDTAAADPENMYVFARPGEQVKPATIVSRQPGTFLGMNGERKN